MEPTFKLAWFRSSNLPALLVAGLLNATNATQGRGERPTGRPPGSPEGSLGRPIQRRPVLAAMWEPSSTRQSKRQQRS